MTKKLSESMNSLYFELDKIDAHMHLNTARSALLDEAGKEGFRLITINTEVPFFPDVDEQKEIVNKAGSDNPGKIDFITTFRTDRWGESDWADEQIDRIQKGMDDGALGVKIWKNIGMELRDKSGNFIMADHPSFDPIYQYLTDHEIPLLAHLGEPKNCWLPLDEMTVTSDRDYFSAYPQYHMNLHPEYPSYELQLDARDHVLARHRKLKFIGAHLASLEWSVDKLAVWLDDHPSAAVDLAERVCHLQYQAADHHGKVKQFVERYQDRIIYGSDQIDDGSPEPESIRTQIRQKWRNEFRFFADSDNQAAWNVSKPFKGLGLSKDILKKLFHDNALKYYPGI
jgi:predicted TIM-barrel fold metal-dependent hydrolase